MRHFHPFPPFLQRKSNCFGVVVLPPLGSRFLTELNPLAKLIHEDNPLTDFLRRVPIRVFSLHLSPRGSFQYNEEVYNLGHEHMGL